MGIEPRKIDHYAACKCILPHYCDGKCNPVFADELATRCRAEGGNTSNNEVSDLAAKAPAAQADDLRLAICNIPLPVYGSNSFQHGFVSAKEVVLDLLSKRAASPASAPEAMTSEQQPATQQDEDAKDAARLDWLMQNNSDHSLKIKGFEGFGWFVYDPVSDTSGPYLKTAREAIDRAMSAHQAKKGLRVRK